MEHFEFARVNLSGNILLVNGNSCIVRRKKEEFIVRKFQFCFLRKWQWISEGHFVLVIRWMYDVLLQVCLAIAHYSHPADPQLLFGFEYVGKRYHGSAGKKTRAAVTANDSHCFHKSCQTELSCPYIQFPCKSGHEKTCQGMQSAHVMNIKIYIAAIIGLYCNM